MTPIIRNFLSVIRRFKLAALLNILGLSVAFAAFMVIMIQVDFDRSFDRFHKDAGRIFRVELSRKTSVQGVISRPLAEKFFESSPAIEAGVITNPWMSRGAFFYVETADGTRNFFEEKNIQVSPSFTDVFTFDFTEGDREALKTPDNILIPLSMARKLFGNEPAVGKQLFAGEQTLIVGAVYRDLPANSILNNCIYLRMPENENKTSWGNWNYHVYIRVNDAAAVPGLWENFKNNFDAKAAFGEDFSYEESGVSLRLTALPDIHYTTDVQFDNTPKSSRQTLSILFAIALVIVIIAGINFTNFSTALTPMRIKSINTQKVLGARPRALRLSIVVEAVIICLLSYLIALCLVLLFRSTPLAGFVDGNLAFVAHPLIVGGTALLALLTGALAGVYPAHYMTSFAPALVLKGSFGLSPKGRKLRNTLIGIQFIASFALMIGATFMYLQNRYMQQSPLGYDKDALLTVDIRHAQNDREALVNNLNAWSGIDGVTFGESLLSSSDQYMSWGRPYKGKSISYEVLPVEYTFLDVMGIEITEGRNFRREDAATQRGVYIFNETARKRYELELNSTIDESGDIVGFMPDVKFASFRSAVEPMAFYVWGAGNWGPNPNNMYVRIKAGTDVRAAMEHIRSTLAGINADYPFNVRFYDDVLQRLYEKEVALSALISLFSAIAIFIAIVGVFGLVVFDSECRRKEIGIRKVLGASTLGIINMFNKAYFRILTICFVIAAPLAWYVVHRWLENFAYKTPMHWWVYALAFVAVGIITAGTVIFQNWRVASANPVEAIKME